MSFYVCLSHDVDRVRKTFQYISHPAKNLLKGNLRSLSYQIHSIFLKNPYWQFEDIIEIESNYKVKSTFFFLNESYPFKPFSIKTWPLSVGYYNIESKKICEIIKKLDQNGWEIGLHGSYLSYKNKLLLKKEKETLEKIIGHQVIGIRQHFLNMDDNTWKIQKEIGFAYDSTFGNRNNAGFKDEKFNLFTPEGIPDFYIVPMSVMDMSVMNKPDPWSEILRIVDLAEKNDACLVANWHHRVFNENEFPGYRKYYIRLIEECKNRNAVFTTITEYINKKKKNVL